MTHPDLAALDAFNQGVQRARDAYYRTPGTDPNGKANQKSRAASQKAYRERKKKGDA